MFFSFRAKLFAISVAVLALFVALTGLYLHESLRGWAETRLEQELERQAELLVALIDHPEGPAAIGDDDWLSQALTARPDPRVTIIDAQGVVLADTYLEQQAVDDVENHGDRPEVQQALRQGVGRARRHSDTVDRQMLYVAVADDQSQTVVRLATPLSDVAQVLAHLRLLLGVAAAFGLAVAILMSSLASKLMSRTLQKMLDRARDPGDATDPGRPAAERRATSRSLAQITDTLEETLTLLAGERDRFRAVLEGMSDGLVATDADLTITLCNQTLHDLTGVDDALVGQPMSTLIPKELIDRLVANPDEGIEFDLSDAPYRRVHLRATPRRESQGFIFVFHDVTALRQLQTIRRDFVANISHELRTPVAVIQANAETLLDGALDSPEHARSFSAGIARNGQRLARLVDELLELSRIEAGERTFAPEPVALSTLVAQVLADAEHVGEDQVRFATDVADDHWVKADRSALEQVLINLVHNALKYGVADGGTISVQSEATAEAITVAIADDGPGIAASHQDRIFERFYRVDTSRADHHQGVGLGLSIVKHLITSMGGQVGYRRGDQGGSIFWFRLPRTPANHA